MVLGGAVGWLSRGGDPELGFSVDLSHLRSVDDLYTAPQIRQQLGYSLDATAFARAALRQLGRDPRPLAPAARRRLATEPGGLLAREALAHALLARDGSGVRAPSPARLRDVWRMALEMREDEVAIRALADVVEATGPEAGGGQAPAAGARRLAGVLRRTAGVDAGPVVIRARARVIRAFGLPPDPAVRAVARRKTVRATTTEARITDAVGIIESAAAAGVQPAASVVGALTDAASQSDDPESIWVALGALRAVGRGHEELAGRAVVLQRALGAVGAVRELAVFETIPKAVWIVAHLYLASGAKALPERDTVALSKAMARRDELTDDPDDRALLFASARLSGLSYDDTALARAPVPAATVASVQQAITWAQRAQVAADLDARPVGVAVERWQLREDVDVAALGLVLAVSSAVGTKLVLPPGTATEFATAAAATTFRSSRWALWAAAGLVAIGREAAADELLRAVRVGCPGFPHLIADGGGTCDLESTWFALRLADEGVASAQRLRTQIIRSAT